MAKTKLPKTKKELKALEKETKKALAVNNKEFDRLSKLENDINNALDNVE